MNTEFDGDTGSANAPMSVEALEENRNRIRKKEYWFDTSGRPTIELTNDVVSGVIDALLKRPKELS